MAMNRTVEARRLLRRCRSGALATVSKRLDGYPFASVVPFMTHHDAHPVLLISRLAEHTRNIRSDPRVSLMVHEPGADVQVAARLTIAGQCVFVDDPGSIRSRYLQLFPAASELLALDFDFYRIAPVAIRYIGGFGAIHWLPVETFAVEWPDAAEMERAWLPLLNTKYSTMLHDCCRHFNGSTPDACAAVALDCDGIDIRTADTLLRVSFNKPVAVAEDLPQALEELAAQCRP